MWYFVLPSLACYLNVSYSRLITLVGEGRAVFTAIAYSY